MKDAKTFTRKLRLGEYFLDIDAEGDDSLVKNKSNFIPPKGRNNNLEKYIEHIETTASVHVPTTVPKNNISYDQRQALKELQNNPNIIIKEADKGGAIVVMDREYYKEKILEMLQDSEIYKEIPSCMDKNTLGKIQTLISQYGGCLTDKEKDFLVKFENHNSQFYGLPKVHKSQQIIEAIERQNQDYVQVLCPTDLKFRPIVAGPSCPTHRLSHLIDTLLKPFLQHTSSYVRDDIDFLTKLPSEIQQSESFVTFDITNLYSNITNELGLEAIEYWLTTYPDSLHPRISQDFVKNSLKVILENNSFSFGNRYFLQIQGTAMGTKMAPTYANLTLAYLEKTLYTKIKTKYTADIGQRFEKLWKRYIDDCFIIWDSNIDSVEALHSELNRLHPKLTFTLEHSNTQISFLDVMLRKENREIITDIFHKSTDTKQYLHFKSCHPRSTKNNIPYILARRICTIVTKPNLRRQRLQEMQIDLQKRGYPLKLIQQGIEKANNLSIETLRTPKQVTETNVCTYVSTYNPMNRNLWQEITQSLDILQSDRRCNRLLESVQIINSKRQPPSLKKILTHAKFQTEPPSVTKCQDKRCGTCPHLITGDHFTFKGQQKPFQVKFSMNCASENLLYVLECQGCGENYIGQTSDMLRARMRVHKQHILTPEYRKLAVSKHIAECAHDKEIKFKVFPFYKIMQNNKTFRDVKEQTFIRTFKPALNSLMFDRGN